MQKIVDNQPIAILLVKDEKIHYANKCFLEYGKYRHLNALVKSNFKLYEHYEKTKYSSYEEFSSYANKNKIFVQLENDTFVVESSNIDDEYILFTLYKVTCMYNEQKKLQEKIQIDTLTSTFRKKYFDAQLEQHIDEGEAFGLIVIDIDDFKHINDTYGHQIGDSVLKEFALLLKKNIRKDDILARWGGEEFLLILQSDNRESVVRKAETLRKIIEAHTFKGIKHLTASFGVAWSYPEDDSNSLLLRADKALYEAKSGGKNRVVLKLEAKLV